MLRRLDPLRPCLSLSARSFRTSWAASFLSGVLPKAGQPDGEETYPFSKVSYFDDDLEAQLAKGDEGMTAFWKAADEHVHRGGLGAAPAGSEIHARPHARRFTSPPQLDLRAAGVTSLVWATGFRADFGWIRLPAFDAGGEPVHRRGVSPCAGLYFLGLPWLHKLKSSVLCGVGEDAQHLAERIASR